MKEAMKETNTKEAVADTIAIIPSELIDNLVKDPLREYYKTVHPKNIDFNKFKAKGKRRNRR